MTQQIKERVRELIVRTLELEVDPAELADDEVLLGSGLAGDSVAALKLVYAVEHEFGFEVADDELHAQSLQSVDALAALVAAKMGSAAGTDRHQELRTEEADQARDAAGKMG